MAVADFAELKTQICQLLDNEIPASLSEAAGFPMPGNIDALVLTIDDCLVILTHAPEAQGDRAILFCELGTPPDEVAATAYARLLEVNFLLYRGNSPGFGRDPATGKVMSMMEVPFATATAAATLAQARRLAEQAALWRRTYFLDPQFDAVPVANAPGDRIPGGSVGSMA